MLKKLSIIIPCYNSTKTLEETISSVYTQNLTIPFEVVMVDDGSVDGTKEMIESFSQKHEEIRYIFHENNKGGGAARNTGIKHSDGDLIFCLDSDNFFPPNILQGMVDCLDKNSCDGVVVYDRRFFMGNNTKSYTSHINNMEEIVLDNLFDGSGALLDNFLFTKESYLKTSGYPENHGFDTQCFEVRYLSNLPKVCVDGESVFYHRQDPGQNSYFQRVYKNGDFSKNFYFIYEDIIHLFSSEVVLEIVRYDVFKNSKLGENNLKSFVEKLYKKFGKEFYKKDHKRFMITNGLEIFYNENKDSKKEADMIVCAVHKYRAGDFNESIAYYNEIFKEGLETPVLYFGILRNYLALSGQYNKNNIDDSVSSVALSLLPASQKMTSAPSFLIKYINKFPGLKKVFKKLIK